MRTLLTLCLFGTALCFSNLAHAAGDYVFHAISKPTGNTWTSAAVGVNESGKVIVAVAPAPSDKTVSYIWDLQNPNLFQVVDCGTETVASGINDSGQVVVRATPGYPQWDAHIWKDGTDTNLGQVPSYNQAIPNCINNNGIVVGYCASGPYTPWHAMIGDAATGLRLLPGVGDQEHTNSYAYCINNQNKVVGSWEDSGLETAYVWENENTTILTHLTGANSSRARGINDQGIIVGMSGSQAVMWDSDGVHGLGTLGSLAEALSVNSQGITVGRSIVDGVEHAFVWKNDQMFDLNTLTILPSGWVLNSATDINDSGMIVGYGTNENGQYQAFALVPEPATLLLLGLGGLALRKRSK